jgi:hypothetical protein
MPGLQIAVPGRLAVHPRLLLPTLVLGLLIVLAAVKPTAARQRSVLVQLAGLLLVIIAAFANAYSVKLVLELLQGMAGDNPTPLLGTGAAIYITNVIAFALWYWAFDRGGPLGRERHQHRARLPVPADGVARAVSRLACRVRGLSLPCVHQRHRVQPDGHTADQQVGEDDDDAAVGHRSRHRRADHRPRGERAEMTLSGSSTAQPAQEPQPPGHPGFFGSINCRAPGCSNVTARIMIVRRGTSAM